MDFKLTADQESLRKLAAQALAHGSDGKSDTWHELAQAGLLGIAIPAELGGAGLGFLELCVLCEQAGKVASAAPLVPVLVSAALPIARFGSRAQKEQLAAIASGDRIVTAALFEAGADDPTRPTVRAVKDGAAYRLDGVKICVAAADRAHRILVPAVLDSGQIGLFLLDPNAAGVRRDRQIGTDELPLHQLTLTGARADELLGTPAEGATILRWLVERTQVALCAVELGVAQRQLEMISSFTVTRKQFGKPIGTFQAVAQRAADAYIDVEAIRLTTWQAAFRLAEERPDDGAVAVARFWAADAGQRVAVAAQHLHGGIGFDRAYPLYRYFLAAKQLELQLGGASAALATLGARLASNTR
jgi:alkylation response protein AidB-like acyl-CoA dehydrogenase